MSDIEVGNLNISRIIYESRVSLILLMFCLVKVQLFFNDVCVLSKYTAAFNILFRYSGMSHVICTVFLDQLFFLALL
jgi:hypothetical protein